MKYNTIQYNRIKYNTIHYSILVQQIKIIIKTLYITIYVICYH